MSSKIKIILALLIVALAVARLLIVGYDRWTDGGMISFVVLLQNLVFFPEKIQDERVKQLKLLALQVGFVVGFFVTVAYRIALLFLRRPDLPRSISAYDFMFVTLLTAFALFHFWRYRDGREIA